MNYTSSSSSYRHPYSHQTRFKVVHSTTKLVKQPKVVSQFKLVRTEIKPTIVRTKSIEKSTTTTIAKHIGNKYKWIRTSIKNNRLVRIGDFAYRFSNYI